MTVVVFRRNWSVFGVLRKIEPCAINDSFEKSMHATMDVEHKPSPPNRSASNTLGYAWLARLVGAGCGLRIFSRGTRRCNCLFLKSMLIGDGTAAICYVFENVNSDVELRFSHGQLCE